jgi:hypothetical protein
VYGKVCCTCIISSHPLTCPSNVLSDVMRGAALTNDGIEWRSVTGGILACGGAPKRLDWYDGTAYSRCRPSSVYRGIGPSGPISPRFCCSRFVHQRKTKNATMIPNAIPPNTPPAIAAVLGEALLLSVFATELVCAEGPLVVLAACAGRLALRERWYRRVV